MEKTEAGQASVVFPETRDLSTRGAKGCAFVCAPSAGPTRQDDSVAARPAELGKAIAGFLATLNSSTHGEKACALVFASNVDSTNLVGRVVAEKAVPGRVTAGPRGTAGSATLGAKACARALVRRRGLPINLLLHVSPNTWPIHMIHLLEQT